MMHLLIRRKLARRTERFYKKPKPGRKRLTKWPRKLQPLPLQEQVLGRTVCCLLTDVTLLRQAAIRLEHLFICIMCPPL